MEQFLKVLKSYKYMMPPAYEKYLLKNVYPKKLSIGDEIPKSHIDGYIYFIENGLAAIVSMNTGRELVKWFKKENSFIPNARVTPDNESKYGFKIVALEDCELRVFPPELTAYLFEHHTAFLHHFIKMMEVEIVHDAIFDYVYSLNSVTARLDYIRQETPDLLRRVPLSFLARYFETSELVVSKLLKSSLHMKMPVQRRR